MIDKAQEVKNGRVEVLLGITIGETQNEISSLLEHSPVLHEVLEDSLLASTLKNVAAMMMGMPRIKPLQICIR